MSEEKELGWEDYLAKSIKAFRAEVHSGGGPRGQEDHRTVARTLERHHFALRSNGATGWWFASLKVGGEGQVGVPLKALEVMGTIDEQRRLHLDEPLPIIGPSRVRVILMLEETDIDEREWLRAAAMNPAFDFLREPEEDIYTLADGKQFYGQR
jgi:hypothetical protein